MDMEKTISVENPSFCLKKKKRKRPEMGENTIPEPPVPTNMEATTSESAADATSGKKKRDRRRKRSEGDTVELSTMDHERSFAVPEKAEITYLEKLKGKTKTRDNLEVATNLDPTNSEATKLNPTADVNKKRSDDSEMTPVVTSDAADLDPKGDVAPRKKKKRKKTKQCDDLEKTIVDDQSTLFDPENAEATNVDPIALVSPAKEAKTNRSDDLEMTTLVVPTELEATSDAADLDPKTDVVPGKKKKNKKTKHNDDLEMTAMENESAIFVPAKIEATVDAENSDPTTDVAPGGKTKKKKTKSSDDLAIKTLDNESILFVPTIAETTNLDPTTQVTSGDKKKKKKTKKNDDLEVKTVDSEGIVLAPIKADSVTEDTILDPKANVTPGIKKKKMKSKRSDNLEMTSMNYGSTSLGPSENTMLEPAANVTSGGKKMKKKTKRSNNPEIATTENVTAEKKNLKSSDDLGPSTVDSQNALSVPARDEATNSAPAANGTSGKKRRKKKSKKSADLKMDTVDNDSTLLGNNGTGGHGCQEPSVNKDGATNSKIQVSESVVNTEPLVSQESVPTTKSERKKGSESSYPEVGDLDNEVTLETIATERNALLESSVSTEGRTSENPTADMDLSCSDKEKRKTRRKKKNKNRQAEVDNNQSNDKVGKLGVVTGTQLEAEQLYPEFRPSLENGKDKDQIKELKDLDMSAVENAQALDQTTITTIQGITDAEELGKDNKNLAMEDAGLNETDIKENSLAIEEPFGLLNGVETSSIRKSGDGAEVGHVLGSKETETYKTEGRNDSINLRDGNEGDTLSHGLVVATSSVLPETTSSQVNGVPKQVVELLPDKETFNGSDTEFKGNLHLDAINKEGSLLQVPEALPERTLVLRSRKKLLILDVNGILVDFVNYNPRNYKADITISKKYVFKRPYCDEFIRFCFERFNVGVWSSRMKQNMEKAINFLFQDSKQKLFFCWDQSHCTMTGFNTVDNKSKPLVLKELRNVWEKVEPDLPFEKGEYDETNTLLLDDSPYKALRNPANTAIFPEPYTYTDRNDDALGPEGALRMYLEHLSMTDNVQKYVENNPFGQSAITETHKSWTFYSKIINGKAKDQKSSEL